MNNKNIFFVFLRGVLILLLFQACKEKPSEPEYNNVFDPDNKNTSGDPFLLVADIIGEGIQLTWMKIVEVDLSGYHVYRRTGETGSFQRITNSAMRDTVYIDTTITYDVDYWYCVTAVNKSGRESLPSSEISMMINSPPTLPVVATDTVSLITGTSVQCGGTIISNGGAAITVRGVCWSINQAPTIEDSITTDGTGSGSFSSSITGLNTNITYYVRAYATNSVGTGFGNEVFFTTQEFETGIVTDIDGNMYKTVKIGNQWWMADNLKVTHYRNGEAIFYVSDSTTWIGLSSLGAYCSYSNDEGYIETYGLLYNWHAVNDSRNVSPAGWHVPTDEEWKELEMYLGMSQADADKEGWRGTNEGGKMKEKGTIHWNFPNIGAINESGFLALPGGYRDGYSADYIYLGDLACFWSRTGGSSEGAWSRVLGYSSSDINRGYYHRRSGFNVRCVRND